MQVMQKLSDEVYDKLYVTSDTHFGHDKEFLYEPRGYKNQKEMNSDMISIINSNVGKDGILLHLGDFCLNTSTEEYHEILKNLKIKEIWMIWGNHNNPIQKSYGGTREQVVAYNNGIFIRYLNHYYTFKNKKNIFVCSHYPFQTWEGVNEGSMHLHGHCHNNLLTSREDDKTRKILDVGWDAFNRPLHITEISEIMKTKSSTNT